MYLIGDTIRLTVEFRNFDGDLESPADVTITIYDGSRTVVATDDVLPYEEGKFRYDYTIPADPPGPLYYEFAGELGGKPIVAREILERSWV